MAARCGTVAMVRNSKKWFFSKHRNKIRDQKLFSKQGEGSLVENSLLSASSRDYRNDNMGLFLKYPGGVIQRVRLPGDENAKYVTSKTGFLTAFFDTGPTLSYRMKEILTITRDIVGKKKSSVYVATCRGYESDKVHKCFGLIDDMKKAEKKFTTTVVLYSRKLKIPESDRVIDVEVDRISNSGGVYIVDKGTNKLIQYYKNIKYPKELLHSINMAMAVKENKLYYVTFFNDLSKKKVNRIIRLFLTHYGTKVKGRNSMRISEFRKDFLRNPKNHKYVKFIGGYEIIQT